MNQHHPEDCMHCRARALGLTEEQAELVAEAMTVGMYAGWTQRGMVAREPTEEEGERMLLLARITWTHQYGTLIPESDEVQAHRHREH